MNRHDFRPAHLAIGLIFAAVAIGALVEPYDNWSVAEWILPSVFVAVGGALLLGAIAEVRRGRS
jgi:hypothetical protein